MSGSEYEFTPDMREISGFGGGYEAACRAMVVAGCRWFDARAAQDGTPPRFAGWENLIELILIGLIGLIEPKNPEAKALTDAMCAAAEPLGGSPTGTMMQAAVHHVLFIRCEGWEKYVATMVEYERERRASARSRDRESPSRPPRSG